MKKLILFHILLTGSFGLSAQKNVTAAGDDASGSGGSASYSLGQLDHVALSGSSGYITQGVQQPYEIFEIHTTVQNNLTDNMEINLFPNPTVSEIILSGKYSNEDKLEYTLYNELGDLLEKGMLTVSPGRIEMSRFKNGTYFLSVIKNTNSIEQFKIVKNQ